MDCVSSGLVCVLRDGRRRPVELQSVRVEASVYDLCAEVKVQQTYVHNSHVDALQQQPAAECEYVFPLDEESAVFSFVCDLDGEVVHGEIAEKKAARERYRSAVSHRQSAMLLEQSSDNVFVCRIGQLRPGSVCTVAISYLTQLDQQGRSNRFTLPMIVAPKYTPPHPGPTPPFDECAHSSSNNVVHSGFQCDHCRCTPIIGSRHRCTVCPDYDLCDGCWMRPGAVDHDATHAMSTFTTASEIGKNRVEQPAHINPPNDVIQATLRDLSVDIKVCMPSPIVSVECPSHPQEIQIQREPDGRSDSARVSFRSTSSCSLSSDFILLVEQRLCFDPRVLCELDMANHTAAISLAFVPPALDMLSATQLRCELIFLIDCSGSMDGLSISCVRECMHLVLRSLPVNSFFNLFVFGSTWSSLFPSSRVYDDKSLAAASEFVANLEADLGGTELYPPLHHALTSDLLPTHPRQIFLLTDGQVSNVQQLVQLASQHAVSTRLFTFGIGTSVDRLLCKKLAQAGRGNCEFVTATDSQGGDMTEKVNRQVARAMQPALTDVKVDWSQLCPDASAASASPSPPASRASPFLQCPSVAPAIFMNSRYVLHALHVSVPNAVWQQVEAGQQPAFHVEIAITARSNHPHESDYMSKSVLLTGQQITQATVIHTLAAKARIRDLEDQCLISNAEVKKQLESQILQLALKYTLTSSCTSFVLVYDTSNKDKALSEILSYKDDSLDTLSESVFSTSSHRRVSFGGSGMSTQSARRWLTESQRCTYPTSTFGWTKQSEWGSTCTFGSSSAKDYDECARAQECEELDELCEDDCAPALFEDEECEVSCEEMELCEEPFGYVNAASLCQSQQREAKDGMPQKGPFKSPESAFQSLIQLQSANGAWKLTPTLMDVAQAVIPSSTVTVKSLATISSKHCVDQEVVAVLFALFLLETQYKQRQTEWQMLAAKAQYFITNNAKVHEDLQEKIRVEIRKQIAQG